jgi:Na+-driven multidrug efflux pump
MAFPLALALNVQGMVLIVGATLGPLAVVTFSTLRTLTRLALQAILSISHAAEPEFAAVFGAGNPAILGRLYRHVARAGLWLALLTCFALAITGDWLVAVWTDGKVAMNAALFYWLLASAVAGSLWYTALVVLKSGNVHLHAANIYVFLAIIALGVAYLAMEGTKQVETAGMTLLLVDGAMAAYTIRAAAHVCGERAWRLLLSTLNPLPFISAAWRKAHVH